ncbi:hypothetical protein FNV43_RR22929 [Rhamnella rubrinervis]|uniref:Uncharacterized protein n=1 Tax=Rhamnella rubrinervis TaxID=2594499 RepID=A0A8K0GNN1_9ROSA|nr:hypothetical protein FNV43_RR22929 [Rhamnella rubrinervis]
MAPTAAMLILSHPHHNKSNSSPSLPLPSFHATLFGGKIPVAKWFSEEKPIFKPVSVENCKVDNDTCEALEKRFEEALQLSCW